MIHQDGPVERGRIYKHKPIAGKGKCSDGRQERNPRTASEGGMWKPFGDDGRERLLFSPAESKAPFSLLGMKNPDIPSDQPIQGRPLYIFA